MAFIYGGEDETKGQHHPQSFREAIGPGCVVCNDHSFHDISDRLRVVPIFPQGHSERNVKIIPTRERRDAVGRAASSRVERGMIFTLARFSLALVSLSKNGDYS